MTLKTEVDTREMRERIREAFEEWGAGWEFEQLDVFYEHGQWWVRAFTAADDPDVPDRTFSVVAAEGGDAVDGFSFQEI